MSNIDFHHILGLVGKSRWGLELFLEENPQIDVNNKEKIQAIINNLREAIDYLDSISRANG